MSWAQLSEIIEALYSIESEYAGYDESEARELARSLYDHGVVPGAWLKVLRATDHGDGTWTVWVTVTDEDGTVRTDLSAEDFIVDLGGASGVVTNATTVRDLEPGDAAIDVSLVIDDSGSVTDCDARAVAAGLASLYSQLPDVLSTHLIKFDGYVYLLEDWTADSDAIVDAVSNVCTQRGSTAAWDAGLEGLTAFEGSADLELQLIFTDGLDNSSRSTGRNYRQAAMDAGIPVYVAALGLPDIFELSRLAQRTGGGLMYVPSGERIEATFQTLGDFIGQSVRLQVEADPGAELTIEVDGLSDTVESVDG